MNILDLTKYYQQAFTNTQTPRAFFAPGRINLIGEHTDYNGGNVLPASISFGTYALALGRQDRKLRFYSVNFPDAGVIECDLDDLSYQTAHDWANYPKGMLLYLQEAGYQFDHGIDVLFYGNIPNGAGLSSSASIEMVMGVLLEELFELNIDRIDLIRIGQKVENNYIGVNSGIMDQFAIGMGKQNHAILLNCQTLNYQYAPLVLKDHLIIIMNTNKQRTLAGSKYNERRAQCEAALSDLQTLLPVQTLGDVTIDVFESNQLLIKNETNRKRARHIVYENARTVAALEKLNQNDLTAFGTLMNESHLSLQHDYEVSGIELDTIVEAAWEQPGVLGARMTGAGFGGCAIAIVESESVDDFKENVSVIYKQRIGYEPTFYTAEIGDGAREISEGVLK
ncbi:galactokinase [Oceanobacillus chungangensis]|uniref:Galactokinase n=1 Tax=Oceanobacillus chungangensis TaxID=1229152 RepID=A0A3D8PY59_9BACI|nr:galactokinase [Oceanobacillus chungangensis]RDW20712.1 galactokinase [Oceanobacillus chungangensis]